MINQIFELYARCGNSLKSIGINEAVLPINEIEYALELFLKTNLLILGGDIYEKDTSGNIVYAYASWSYDGTSVLSGIEESRSYLNQFTDNKLLVSFVIQN
ncbi:Imm40 family immunity protein [Orbus sturtevantii]|uniref:hypothetical protein n=1 Tax=Orbus sturtevantii TaxID=3074109 RepID=UPI00370D4B4C